MLADRVDWQFGNCDSTGTRAMSPLRVGSSASYRISIANKGHPWRYSSLVDSTSCQRSFTRDLSREALLRLTLRIGPTLWGRI